VSAHRLESKRLLVLPWESADWIAFRPIATDPQVMKYISDGQIWSDEKIIEFVERQRHHYRGLGFCLWKLVSKDEPRLVGFCGLQPLDDLPGVEIGWWLASDLWGRGFATEAAEVALTDGFHRLGLKRIVAVALRENTASTHIMEKLGMRFEKETMHHGFRVVLYAIDEEEFREAPTKSNSR
jgi:[ribosomal protein S5]-alanine N-acetyltransferase